MPEPDRHETLPHPSAPPADAPRAAPARSPQRFVYAGGDRPLDGYTIKRGVGQGGFGEIYYATSNAGKDVALKLIRRNLDVELRGIRQCLNLKHPHLLDLYDIRQDVQGDTWVVMEYIADGNLEDILASQPGGLPPQQALAWIHGIAAGVAYLHEHGIVHRDLKPGNIFSDEGVVKLGDYGLSKFISCSRRSGHTESIGTVHYMAPEIANGRYGKEIDIYALGVLLYELLTGRVPFEGESVGEVLMKHLTARPDVSMLPEPYRSVVAKALEKDPELRFRSATDMLAALPLPNDRSMLYPHRRPPTPQPAPVEVDCGEPKGNGQPHHDTILVGNSALRESVVGRVRRKLRSLRKEREPDDRRRWMAFLVFLAVYFLTNHSSGSHYGSSEFVAHSLLLAFVCSAMYYALFRSAPRTQDEEETETSDRATAKAVGPDPNNRAFVGRSSQEGQNTVVMADVVPEEPILRAVRQKCRGVGEKWREHREGKSSTLLWILGAILLVVLSGPIFALLVVLTPFVFALCVLYGVYRLAWMSVLAISGKWPSAASAAAASPGASIRKANGNRSECLSSVGTMLQPPRQRAAELLGSMLLAALAAAAMTVVMVLIEWFRVDAGGVPHAEQIAWLLLTSTLGAWGVLIPSKLWEGKRGDPMVRRFVLMVLGMGVGAAAFGLGELLMVTLPPAAGCPDPTAFKLPPSFYGVDGHPLLLAHVACFATLFLVIRWWLQTDPMRPVRLSVWKVIVSAAVAGVAAMLWQFPQPWLPMVVGTMSVAVQLASPWRRRNRR